MMTSGSSRRAPRRAVPKDSVWVCDLALGDVAALGLEDVLDGIFQRDDVIVPGAVHFFHQGGERGGFAAAHRAGDEDEAVMVLREQLQLGGQAQFVHGAHLGS